MYHECVTGKCKSNPRFKSVQVILNFKKFINIIIGKNIAGFSIAALILEISLVVHNSGYAAIFLQSLLGTPSTGRNWRKSVNMRGTVRSDQLADLTQTLGTDMGLSLWVGGMKDKA